MGPAQVSVKIEKSLKGVRAAGCGISLVLSSF
jgi:hypothetical protein